MHPDIEIYECRTTTLFGLVMKGCGWKGKIWEMREEYYSTMSPAHPLSGEAGYKYLCPKCGKELDRIIIEQS